jgi:hypothetical protein
LTRLIIFAIGCLCIFNSNVVNAQSSLYEELQTAYLYNFAKYVNWPAERETFVIGIYGEPYNLEFLETYLESKKMKGKAIEVVVLKDIKEIEEKEINMIYVPDDRPKNFTALIDATAGKTILVVTGHDMIKKGAMISFVMEEDKLRFKIKKSALESVGLTASEGLLKLAILL